MSDTLLFFQFTLIVFILVSTFQIAGRLRPAQSIIVRGQIVFWILGLVLNPIVIWDRQITPKYGDYLARPSLYSGEGVLVNLAKINQLTIIGASTFLVYVYLASKRLKLKMKSTQQNNQDINVGYLRHSFSKQRKALEIRTFPLIVMFILGLVGLFLKDIFVNIRPFAWLSTSLLSTLGLFILSREDSRSKSRFPTMQITSLIIGTFISYYENSKTPILFVVLMLIIHNRQNKRRTPTRNYESKIGRLITRIFSISAISVIMIFVFVRIQALKQDSNTNNVDDQIGQIYFGDFEFLYPFFKRFDALRSISEVLDPQFQPWSSPRSFLSNMFTAIQWNYGTTAANYGQLWHINIVGRGFDGDGGRVASLSQHPIAEGFLTLGKFGVVLWVLAICTFCSLVSKWVNRSLFFSIVAIQIVASGSLFENAIVANIENLSNSLKIALFVYPLWLILLRVSQRNKLIESENSQIHR